MSNYAIMLAVQSPYKRVADTRKVLLAHATECE